MDMRIGLPIIGEYSDLESILSELSQLGNIEVSAGVSMEAGTVDDILQQYIVTANVYDMAVQFSFNLIDVVEHELMLDLEHLEVNEREGNNDKVTVTMAFFTVYYLLSVDIL
jgi:hypothetical protein